MALVKKNYYFPFFTLLLLAFGIMADAQLPTGLHTEEVAAQERQAYDVIFKRNTASSLFTVASTNFDIKYYRCEWKIDPTINFIKGSVTSYFKITTATDNIIFDLSDTLTVDSIKYGNSLLSFQRIPNDGLQIQFPSVLAKDHLDSVSVYYEGVPRVNNGGAFVQTIYVGNPVIWTLSEPFGSKEWWPCKNGLDDKADSLDIIITNPDSYSASSNGVLLSESVESGLKKSIWKHRYPIASYLVALSVTNFVVLKDTTMIGEKVMNLVDYSYFYLTDYFNQQRNYTKYILHLYGKLFGDYPFSNEKYGYTQFGVNAGMEHQTNSFIFTPNPNYLAHETAHQWFGDKITCGSWEDIWLNEGFASYGEILDIENRDTNGFYAGLGLIRADVVSQPGGSVRVDDTTSSSRIFSNRLSYHKGLMLVHMLRWKLGDSIFFSGIRRYLNDPLLKYNFARTSDLQRNLEAESGQNLHSFFQNWFYGQGYPAYQIKWTQDSTQLAYMNISQFTSHPSVSFYDMPLQLQFKNATRDTILTFNNTKNGESFFANPGFKTDTVIFDPLIWLVSGNNTVSHTDCSIATSGLDTLYPHYNIRWTQNTNNWSYIEIDQTNKQAPPITENIPFYLHFSGNGKDTAFIIKNIRYQYNNWLNIGFKASSVFLSSSSCFMKNNYTLTSGNNPSGKDELIIYPVPANNSNLNISLKNPSDKHLNVAIFNPSGQLIYKTRFETPGKDELFSIPFINLPSGIYVIKVESELSIRTSKKVIKR